MAKSDANIEPVFPESITRDYAARRAGSACIGASRCPPGSLAVPQWPFECDIDVGCSLPAPLYDPPRQSCRTPRRPTPTRSRERNDGDRTRVAGQHACVAPVTATRHVHGWVTAGPRLERIGAGMSDKPVPAAGTPCEPAASTASLMALACLVVFMAQMATTVPAVAACRHARTEDDARRRRVVHLRLCDRRGAAGAVLGRRRGTLGQARPVADLAAAVRRQQPAARRLHGRAGAARVARHPGHRGGGAAIIARIIVRDYWRGDELARRLSVLSIAFITALGGGQFVGGLIGRYSHWQTGFVLMAVIAALAIGLSMALPLKAGTHRGHVGDGRHLPEPAAAPGFPMAGLRGRVGVRDDGDLAGSESVRVPGAFQAGRDELRQYRPVARCRLFQRRDAGQSRREAARRRAADACRGGAGCASQRR